LSNGDITHGRTDFDDWLHFMVGQHGEFTALVILVEISERKVAPVCSTFFHVLGDEIDWNELISMFASSRQMWNGAAFFPTKGANGGPIDNPTARSRLAELEAKVRTDRMTLNEGHFFDSLGRSIAIEPIADHDIADPRH
jgi:hypothetical protein